MQIIIVSDYSEQVAALRALALDTVADRAEGYTHPAAALDWCMENKPDLVVIDYMMRACDGLEFLRRFRAMPHLEGVPVLLMVPAGFGSVKAAAWKLGVTDFLVKPVDPTEFVARIRNLLLLRSAGMLTAPLMQQISAGKIPVRVTRADAAVWRDPAAKAPRSGPLH